MSATLQITEALRVFTDDQEVIDVEGENIKQMIDSLRLRYPDLCKRICRANFDQFVRSVHFHLNDHDIRFLQNWETPINVGDRLELTIPLYT